MAWSLSYALSGFGKNRRHWRKISGEADTYVRLKTGTLQQLEVKREVLAYYFATKSALQSVFFPADDEIRLAFYDSLNSRYGDAVLRLTARSLLNLLAAFHLGEVTTSDVSSGDVERKIRLVGLVYDCADKDLATWCDAASTSDVNLVAARIALAVSDAFRFDPPSKQEICDWFRVLEIVRSLARSFLSGAYLQEEHFNAWLRSG